MRIELEVDGVTAEAWAKRQELRPHAYRDTKKDAEDDLRRAMASASQRMLRSMGFEDAKVRWF